jgi:serine/threonine protein kinase
MEKPAVEETIEDAAGSLPEGRQLGSYKIISLRGAGGMGRVYLAEDTRLGRTVAIKVVTPSRIADDERKRRFIQEARTASALNHPNIVALYDIASDSGTDFLVMEYVEGQSLHKRIPPRGLPVKDAIRYATQIVTALAAAHAAGIVHRDLKPANVMVTDKGVVKVLDFGLAKLMEPPDQAGPDSPTDIARTQEGVILGTASYMSPEQAAGKRVDARSDIFAVGVVLYEMLAGRRAFDKGTVLATLGAVMYEEPAPLNTIVKAIPPDLKRLVERCLRKDPDRRIQTMADLKVVLEDLQEQSDTPEEYEIESRRSQTRRWLPWSVAAVCALALAVSLWAFWVTPKNDDAVSRWVLNAESLPNIGFDLSRDGRRFVYAARGDPQRRLWIRDVNQLKGEPIVGTDGGLRPFFSPDGQWIAFFTSLRDGLLKKVPAAGGSFNTRGAVTTLCSNANYYGGSWASDDTIIFSGSSGLMRVAALGGSCEPVSKADPAEGDHRWPQVLPGGKAVLFTVGIEGTFDSAGVAVLDLNTKSYSNVLEGGANARYVNSGHLVFVRGGQMFAVPFDLDSLKVQGQPEVVIDSIFHVNAGGFAAYTFSDTGELLYATPIVSAFEWRDRRGTIEPAAVPPNVYARYSLSPDGERLAVEQSGRGDVVVVDLRQGGVKRLTSEGTNSSPIWSPDSRSVTFSLLGKGILRVPVNGEASPETLLEREAARPWDWTPDNRTLLYVAGSPLGIWTLTTSEGDRVSQPQRLLSNDKFAYSEPDVSPDGRWLAYVSNESGLPEINVQSYPPGGKTVFVSEGGGTNPRWSSAGGELFYLSLKTQSVMVVDMQTNRGSTPTPRSLIPAVPRAFEVDPTGQRFLVVTQKEPDQLHLIANWFKDLREKLAEQN